MKTSETITKIAGALTKAQATIKHALKDATNPHLKNQYATLESVIDASKEALLLQEIIVIQSPTGEVLTTRLQHSSGEFLESEMKLFLAKQDMQGLGSAITYARRYALAALLNISQTDDDGHASSHKEKPVARAERARLPAASKIDILNMIKKFQAINISERELENLLQKSSKDFDSADLDELHRHGVDLKSGRVRKDEVFGKVIA